MKKIVRSIATAGIAVSCLGGAATLAPASQAADGTPLTYAQLQADPTTLAANANIEAVMDGDFTLKGTQFNAKGGVVVAETLRHKGGMYRIAATQPGVGTRVVISDGKKSCVRTAAKASTAAASKDLAARWTCKNGVDTLLSGELLAITPLGMGEVLDSQTAGLIRFVPSTNSTGAFQMGLTNTAGVQAGVYTLAGPAAGPFRVTITQGANDFVSGRFAVTQGAAGSIPALSKLKR